VPVPGPIPRFDLAEWRARYGIVAGITGRDGDFNLGLLTPAPSETILARWRAFAAASRPGFDAIAAGLQVHGTELVRHQHHAGSWTLSDGCDGHLTLQPGVLLVVSVADCVPVYLVHPPTGAVALLHAGWRGTAAGILESGLAALARATSASAGDLAMHCGVGICGSCYEVGPEVIRAVTGRAPAAPGPLDLRGELTRRAASLGLEAISVSSWCSSHDERHFFSHRRSRGTAGRMLAYLGRPLA
jgi:YfiH family protein